MRTYRRTRSGFTITEMLVAMALIMFIMVVISTAFGSASKTFRELRAAGDMQERMRGAATILRKDLTLEHFDGPFIPGRSGPRVGDQRLDLAGWVPPAGGYFEVRQNRPSTPDAVGPLGAIADGEGIYSTRATGSYRNIGGTLVFFPDHVLRFTMRLPDLAAAELFCAEAPPAVTGNPALNAFAVLNSSVVYSRWAEVSYFLVPNGNTTPPGTLTGPQDLYSLRRRVRVLAPVSTVITPAPIPTASAVQLVASYPEVAFQEVTVAPGQSIVRMLGPDGVTDPGNRVPTSELQRLMNGNMVNTGDDILLTDVLSFEIKLAWFHNQSTPSFNSYGQPFGCAVNPSLPSRPMTIGNTDEPFDDLPPLPANPALALNPVFANQQVFDTFFRHPNAYDGIDWDRPQTVGGRSGFLTPNIGQPPQRINVRAIQFKIRVWDAKAERARQITLVQEI